ncbi:MAG: hypothetical protein K2G06_02155 [Muribaculaceae bacterium]|nr:hypothetical protein [Muribaculaceae bacterium]
MNEDKYTSLFDNFNPDMSPDSLFIHCLEQNLQAVEIVKKHTVEMQRRNRKAIIIAAITGFIVGLLSSFCYPFLLKTINSIAISGTAFATHISDYGSVYIWTLICLLTGILTYSAYDLTLSAQTTAHNPKYNDR